MSQSTVLEVQRALDDAIARGASPTTIQILERALWFAKKHFASTYQEWHHKMDDPGDADEDKR